MAGRGIAMMLMMDGLWLLDAWIHSGTHTGIATK
jgi:hypothetical protein